MPRRNRNANPEHYPIIVRFKNNGRPYSKHFECRTPKQAAKRNNGKGIILSVRKVHPSDIIGTIESMNLEDIIRVPVKRRQSDTILNETTLDSIIFPKIGESKRLRLKRQHLRENRKTQEEV